MKTINRMLLLLATLLVSLCFTGGRCYGEIPRPGIYHPTMTCVSALVWNSYLAIRQEKDLPYPSAPDRSAREHRVAMIQPKYPVQMAYHPQPAHC